MSHWVEIIRKALSNIIETTQQAVPGAKLRGEIAAVAADWGIAFPPPGITKFSAFIESFDKDFIVVRRPGSDFLVAPADRADLFSATATSSPTGFSRLRQDLFQALTTIQSSDGGTPVYVLDEDAVRWIRSESDMLPPKNGIQLPETTLDDEIQLRRSFIESVDVPTGTRGALEKALESTGPLRSFTTALQEHGLSRQWHSFRLRMLSAKLRDWSVANAVPWRSGWLSTNEPVIQATGIIPSYRISRTHLAELIGTLSDDDLKRVTIPLDIVLRLTSSR